MPTPWRIGGNWKQIGSLPVNDTYAFAGGNPQKEVKISRDSSLVSPEYKSWTLLHHHLTTSCPKQSDH